MTESDSAARNSTKQSEDPGQDPAQSADLNEELSRFAHRLAGFGLGEALDVLLARREVDDQPIGPEPDPEPC